MVDVLRPPTPVPDEPHSELRPLRRRPRGNERRRPADGVLVELDGPGPGAPEDPLDDGVVEPVDGAPAHPIALAVGVIGLVVLFLLAAAGWGATTDAGTGRGEVERVVVARTAGRSLLEAQAQLERQGLLVAVEYLANEAAPDGTVFDQRPLAGAKVEVGTEVTLIVSDGPPGVVVPELAGLQAAEAVRLLGALGVPATEVPTPDEAVRVGEVLGSTPAAGVQLGEGQGVSVLVSSGPAPRTVPAVVDRPVAEALAAIGAAGLGIGEVTTTVRDGVAPGIVVASEPASGAEAARGFPVAVTVSAAPGDEQVPPVVGLSRQVAEALLDDSPLDVRYRTQAVPPGDDRDGRVISQSMPPGTDVAAGTPFEVVVAVAPPPATTTTTTTPGATTTTTPGATTTTRPPTRPSTTTRPPTTGRPTTTRPR